MSFSPHPSTPNWLTWAQQLQAIAQAGLTFSHDPYDRERYEQTRRLAAEMMSAQSGTSVERIEDLFKKQTGYPTPKVDVRAAVFRGDTLLLVREKEDGKWTLPGGWADILESPSEAVAREVREEAGFEIRVTKLLAVYDRSKHLHVPPFPFHVYKFFFRGEITGGEAATSSETTDVRFFQRDQIPELSISRVVPTQIARLFDHANHPEWPTDFD